MRERIRARLKQYRAEAVDSIGAAVNRMKSTFSGAARMNGRPYYLAINKDNEAGFATFSGLNKITAIHKIWNNMTKEPRDTCDVPKLIYIFG
jgi:hypothetical protein